MATYLDRLLQDASTREITLKALTTLEEGGGVVTKDIRNSTSRRHLEKALDEFGARLTSKGYWKKRRSSNDDYKSDSTRRSVGTAEGETIQSVPITQQAQPARLVYGVAPLPSSSGNTGYRQDSDEDDVGPRHPSVDSDRKPSAVKQTTSFAPQNEEAKPQRGDWMMQGLKETDPSRILRQQEMLSQKGRSFNNFKTDALGATMLPGAESRATATGKQEQQLPQTMNSRSAQTTAGAFKWNHDEMMAEEKIDKQRAARIMSEKVDSRFAPSSGKFL